MQISLLDLSGERLVALWIILVLGWFGHIGSFRVGLGPASHGMENLQVPKIGLFEGRAVSRTLY